ncbi:MAG TPA: 16S rRNA (cytidine(1402)-2'-O)-methyltransferase [Gemmatimonadales bacterium]|nr:16S rRNA (cytidine(1402)-2'-O)-methyltransferase [Gemmatimonadales bacterium]
MTLGTLYVVATPLGHLGDLSPRASETLRGVDTVAAEDTRRTQGLLATIGATPRLLSYHAHSEARREVLLLEILRDGRDVALVTDAGTPAISDPGTGLVAAARAAGIRVVPIPGPSAVPTAISASGLPGDRYLFLGFLPRKGSERRALIERAAREPWTVVCFEAANRLDGLLEDLIAACGTDRPVVVARELTKLHEELRGGTLQEVREHFLATPPRGEVTVVLGGAPAGSDVVRHDPAEISEAIRAGLAAGESRKDVARKVAAQFNLARNDAYRLVMEQP